MADKNCTACQDLQNDASSLIVNGMSEMECVSLQNDTGLSPSSGNNDCTDLNNMNDCLIGNMVDEIDAYDICDWKEYTKNLVDNIWTVFKGVICAICGLWTNIHNLWTNVNKLNCIMNALGTPQNSAFYIDKSNIRLGTDVSFRDDGAIPGFSGNAFCGYLTGAVLFGSTWTSQSDTNFQSGGRLIYEYRINKADHKIQAIWPGNMSQNNSGQGFHAHVLVFGEGETTYGNESSSDTTGKAVVPAGWLYVQVRMSSIEKWGRGSDGKVTLSGVVPVLMDTSKIEC